MPSVKSPLGGKHPKNTIPLLAPEGKQPQDLVVGQSGSGIFPYIPFAATPQGHPLRTLLFPTLGNEQNSLQPYCGSLNCTVWGVRPGPVSDSDGRRGSRLRIVAT